MNNYQWLLQMDGADRKAWFDAEHVDDTYADVPRARDQAFDELGYEDSREKLEADVRKIADAFNMDKQRHGSERFAHELYYSIIHLLDRQAAMTAHQWESYHNGMMLEWMAKTEELQAQVDELNELNEYHALQYELASEDADRLQAQVDNLTADLNKEIYERERYREKFGKCLDYADAIHALMDDEGLA